MSDLLERLRQCVEQVDRLSTDLDLAGSDLEALERAIRSVKSLRGELIAMQVGMERAKASRARNGGAIDPEKPKTWRNCPECGHVMVVRRRASDQEPFWGCGQFPGCRYTAPISLAERRALENQSRAGRAVEAEEASHA